MAQAPVSRGDGRRRLPAPARLGHASARAMLRRAVRAAYAPFRTASATTSATLESTKTLIWATQSTVPPRAHWKKPWISNADRAPTRIGPPTPPRRVHCAPAKYRMPNARAPSQKLMVGASANSISPSAMAMAVSRRRRSLKIEPTADVVDM